MCIVKNKKRPNVQINQLRKDTFKGKTFDTLSLENLQTATLSAFLIRRIGSVQTYYSYNMEKWTV